MNPLLQSIKETLTPKVFLTTEKALENRLAKQQDQDRLFIRVSTQFLGGRFDTKG